MADYNNMTLERVDTRVKPKEPQQYHVVMHNDNYTPMDYVVMVLAEVFNIDVGASIATMLQIHTQGKGIVGTYTKDVANEKCDLVQAMNNEYNFSLLVTTERA
jgi:ATP-dependent Clp protease adaptor protein ClpS